MYYEVYFPLCIHQQVTVLNSSKNKVTPTGQFLHCAGTTEAMLQATFKNRVQPLQQQLFLRSSGLITWPNNEVHDHPKYARFSLQGVKAALPSLLKTPQTQNYC